MAHEIRRWTRDDFDWLVAQGEALLEVAKRHGNYGAKNSEGRAWLQQVEAWMDAGLPADRRAAIDAASIRLRGFYLEQPYQTMDANAFVEGTETTVEAIRVSASSYRFAPNVADADYVEFLRAARHEDEKLSMGECLRVPDVAKRAGLEAGVAEACARRAFAENIAYRGPSDPDDGISLEHEDVDYAIMRLARLPHGTQGPPEKPAPTWTLDVSGVRVPGLAEVLESNVRELAVAQAADLHLAGIVLAGAIGEGLLYDALVAEKTRAMAAPSAPRRRRTAVDIEVGRWNLADYINVATEVGMLKPTTQRMAHDVLREFRKNMIHAKVQIESDLRPDASELKASVAWLEAVARDLAGNRGMPTP